MKNTYIDRLKKYREYHSNPHEIPELDRWTLERLEEYSNALFKFSKFKIGDRVKIKNAPLITPEVNYGWYGFRDRIVNGAKATIEEVDYIYGNFNYLIRLDSAPDSLFNFKEQELQKVKK